MRPRLILLLAALSFVFPAAARAADDDAIDKRVAELIHQLGDDEYSVRQRAQRELAELGFQAYDALSDAEHDSNIEIATQARYLAGLIRLNWSQPSDPAAIKQILQDYESLNEENRLERVKDLGDFLDEGGLEALARAARFDQSPIVCRQAVIEIMNHMPPVDDQTAWTLFGKLVDANFRRSNRAPAAWLKAYVILKQNPESGLAPWNQIVEAERTTGATDPKASRFTFVIELLKQQADALARLGRADEVAKVTRDMVETQHGDTESLGDLLLWLADHKAWSAIDLAAERFADRFEIDAELLYILAEARSRQGNQALADELGKKALEITGKNAGDRLSLALERLQERGLHHWADLEFQQVLATERPDSYVALNVAYFWSEYLHDRALDEQATSVRQRLVDALSNEEVSRTFTFQIREPIASVRSRMHYYQACHYAAKGDLAKEVAALEAGINAYAEDEDVLIGLYRLKDRTPEQRKDVKDKIARTVDKGRTEILSSPDSPKAYNQLAWLIANTEGNADEAIALSQKSIQLRREESVRAGLPAKLGSFLDTLAHCYFAKGDYAMAVKTQTKAARLEPHSQQITRKLVVFREALEKQKATGK